MAMAAVRSSAYWLVYLVLAVVTALEIWITTLGLARGLQTPILLALSLLKASLVAAFYMHLRSDSRLYLLTFLLPVVMVVGFGLVMLIR
jgi:cytochrome c oxidase subunit 4